LTYEFSRSNQIFQQHFGKLNKYPLGWKSGLVVSKLDSWLEGHGFKSHPIIDGNGVKAMPWSIPAPNPGSYNNWKERKYRKPNGAH